MRPYNALMKIQMRAHKKFPSLGAKSRSGSVSRQIRLTPASKGRCIFLGRIRNILCNCAPDFRGRAAAVIIVFFAPALGARREISVWNAAGEGVIPDAFSISYRARIGNFCLPNSGEGSNV